MSRLDYAVVSYLESKVAENPELAGTIATLEKVLGVSMTSSEDFSSKGYFPTTLDAIFAAGENKLELVIPADSFAMAQKDSKFASFVDAVKKKGFYSGVEEGSVEFLKRQSKLVNKFHEKNKPVVVDTKAQEEEAEVKKSLGNAAITNKDYNLAIQMYSDALDLSPAGPNAHVYYSNRAAAHCHVKDYKSAISDCEASLSMEPTYVKAVSRLGLANFFEGNYEESVKAYERAVELEPDNKASKDALQKAQNKLQKVTNRAAPAAGGMPDMSALAGMMGGMGGAGGLGDMMKNPEMMKMAQQMMSNPGMMQKAQEMMKDPAMMQKAMSMMGGGAGAGGMPDMSSLAGMMGGMSGGGTSGGGEGSSSSGTGSRGTGFTGFGEDD